MEKTLTGLFGSGPEAEVKTERARDFVKRYSEGAPDQGYSTEEAKMQLDEVIRYADSEQVERATRKALSDVPENQRGEFGKFVNELQARKSGGRTTSGQPSVDDISRMFGEAGGRANSLDDLLGGLMGGGSTGRGGAAGGGGFMTMITNFLNSLFGGGARRQTTGATASGDLGGLFGSNTGKIVMGGLAAYLTKEMLEGRQ
jgi:hypothetical protein